MLTSTECNDEKLSLYEAVGIIEGFVECDDDTRIIEAWQHLIDTGEAWRLQGWFGRNAKRMIDMGFCRPAKKAE